MTDRILRRAIRGAALLALAWLAVRPARADQFILKDGRKISGTLVSFQDGMFRVRTQFGFALIRKDKLSRVIVEQGTDEKAEEHAAPAFPKSQPAPESKAASEPATPAPAPPPAAPPAPPVSRPLNEPMPAHIREHVTGTTYVNDTFQFAMYMPPGWKLYEELTREKVSAIVALSSDDNQTLLFVDRQVWSGAPDLRDDRVDARLRSTYQDYHQLSQTSLDVDGLPAVRTRFTGVLDNVEWHGVSVRVARGSTVFGIVGLTSSPMYNFQLAVFRKIVKTFRFVSSPPAKPGGKR